MSAVRGSVPHVPGSSARDASVTHNVREIADAAQLRPLRSADSPIPPPDGSFLKLHQGDARDLARLLSRHSDPRHPLLTTTITSPPYAAMKDYGTPKQIGRGQPDDEYRLDLRRVFRTLHEHTRHDGSLWIVVDSVRAKAPPGEPWRLRMLPFELAAEAEKAEWILRDVIIWHKDKTLPWSSRGRLRNEFEYILYFVRSAKYKHHVDRLREPLVLEEWWVRYPERYNPMGKAPSNVWYVPIPVQGSWANTSIQHACPLPPNLVERMLLLSTDKDDVVIDPFAGSGVVLAEAERLGRRALGVELVQEHIDAFHAVVRPEILQRRGTDELLTRLEASEQLRRRIIELRVLKLPKVLMTQAQASCTGIVPSAAIVTSSLRQTRDGRVKSTVQFFVAGSDADRERYRQAVLVAASHRPASKFGIDASLEVLDPTHLSRRMRGRSLFAYIGGRVHDAAGRCRYADLDGYAKRRTRTKLPVILSPIEVHEAPRPLRK
jgi:DNA modification methylase